MIKINVRLLLFAVHHFYPACKCSTVTQRLDVKLRTNIIAYVRFYRFLTAVQSDIDNWDPTVGNMFIQFDKQQP